MSRSIALNVDDDNEVEEFPESASFGFVLGVLVTFVISACLMVLPLMVVRSLQFVKKKMRKRKK